jgi:hypothetical protein
VGEAAIRGTDELRAVITNRSAARDAEAPGERAERLRERRRLDLCPGCSRPDTWCDAHHTTHWADGGETKLSNLVLLCRPHRSVHEGGFDLHMADGEPVFRRPDGSVLEDRRAPP